MKKEQIKYLLALPALISYAASVMFEGITAQLWWSELPWGTINYTTVVLIVSFLIQDILSPNSWLRKWWFDFRSPYELSSVILNDGYEPARIIIYAFVRFKRIPSTPIANFTLTNTTGRHAGEETHIFSTGLGHVHLNKVEKIPVGVIMISSPGWTPRQSVWGAEIGPEKPSKDHPGIVLGAPMRVGLEIDGFLRSFIVLPTGKSSHKERGAGIAVLTENDAEYVVGIK